MNSKPTESLAPSFTLKETAQLIAFKINTRAQGKKIDHHMSAANVVVYGEVGFLEFAIDISINLCLAEME